jgi:hypothetical protein
VLCILPSLGPAKCGGNLGCALVFDEMFAVAVNLIEGSESS